MQLYIVNLEQGMPPVEKARANLEQALRTAKARRYTAMKVIHGYGSSGKGGAIKRDAHALLAAKKRAGVIRGYVPGERFSPFYEEARKAIDACPGLARDSDYTQGNDGITIVLL